MSEAEPAFNFACRSLFHGDAAPQVPRYCILIFNEALVDVLWSQQEAAKAIVRATGIMGADGAVFFGGHAKWATTLKVNGKILDPNKMDLDKWFVVKDAQLLFDEAKTTDASDLIRHCRTIVTANEWEFNFHTSGDDKALQYRTRLHERDLVSIQQAFASG